MPTEATIETSQENGATRGALTDDAEVKAIVKVMKLLNSLTNDERSRVVRYLAERYSSDLQ